MWEKSVACGDYVCTPATSQHHQGASFWDVMKSKRKCSVMISSVEQQWLSLAVAASFSLSSVVSFIPPAGRIFIHFFIHPASVPLCLTHSYWPSDQSKHVAQFLLRFTNWTGLENIVAASLLPRHGSGYQYRITDYSEIYLFALLSDNKPKFHYHFLTGPFRARAIHSFPLN